MTEEQTAIEKLKQGDLSAVDFLYNKYAVQGLRTVCLITSDYHLSQDILQETFIQCCQKIHTLRNTSLFKSWFYQILTHTAYREIKKAKRLLPVENIFEQTPDSGICDNYFKDSEYSEVYKAIKQLKPKQRAVVVLFYYNQLSIAEISGIMLCSQGTVKSRLNSARKNLRYLLGKEEII